MENLYGYLIYHKVIPGGKELPEWKLYPSHKLYQTKERAVEAIKNIRESSTHNWGSKFKLLKVYSKDEFETID
jgi:hypothetical protein